MLLKWFNLLQRLKTSELLKRLNQGPESSQTRAQTRAQRQGLAQTHGAQGQTRGEPQTRAERKRADHATRALARFHDSPASLTFNGFKTFRTFNASKMF